MNETDVIVLDPTARANVVERVMADRVQSLNGKVIGLLWNSKPNGDLLLHRVTELLCERFKVADVVKRQRRSTVMPAYEAVVDSLAEEADVVINAVAD